MSEKKEKEKSVKSKAGAGTPPQYSIQRYVWLGGALGLYFGWFFRPVREANLWFAFFLSIFIGFVLFALPLLRDFLALAYPSLKAERPSVMALLKRIPLNIVQYFLILVVFEARHYAFDWGGRLPVLVLTGLFGCLFGYWVKIRGDLFGIE